MENFRPLLAQYLEVQKQKDITVLDEREVRGRWKSFVGKWNKGELAEGWYRAETLEEAKSGWAGVLAERERERERDASSRPPAVLLHDGRAREGSDGGSGSGSAMRRKEEAGDASNGSAEEDDDEYGPTLPPGDASDAAARSARHGPGIPSLQDLALRRENAEEERMQDIDDLRLARKADRVEQRERLEDLVPRADAGTRERKLEKKREVNDKMRSFRNKSPGGVGEVAEAELLGGGDEVAELKRAQEAAKRKRSEREVRREEEARARAAEREVRVEEYKRKEESTMQVLRQIARERFG